MNTTQETCCLYCRVSSIGDRQNTDRQVDILTKYASAHNVKILRTFTEHISGTKKLEEREVLMEALEYCKSGAVKYLFITELSRLGRSTLQVLRSLEILNEAKVNVYIHNINQYTLLENGEVNPITSILCVLLSEVANIERTQIAERLSSGRKHALETNPNLKLGRKPGKVSKEQMALKYKDAIALLKKGYSIRNVSKLTGYSIQTIQTVKNTFIKNDEV